MNSKIENRNFDANGDPTQDRRSFDLVPMLAAVSEAFAASAREQRVTLETDLPAHLRMDGDVFRLRQVLDNIVSNAVKYTPAGGSVRVSASLDGDTAVIVVTDTGIGIASEDLEHVFDPLFRSTRAQEQARDEPERVPPSDAEGWFFWSLLRPDRTISLE